MIISFHVQTVNQYSKKFIVSSSKRFTTLFIVVYIMIYVLTSILYNICDVLIASTPVMYLVNS